jgi:arylformamidase
MTHPAPSPAWYDEQYNNRARIPEHPTILRYWAEASAETRERLPWREHAYGPDETERLDLFAPPSPGAPVLVYIHGGYWRALDKRDQSFVAQPFVEAGAMVALPNYALCPAVRIEHIVRQMQRALEWVWRHADEHGGDPSRIVVAGHSAGGHLAVMMLLCDWRSIAADLPEQLVTNVLAVSGLFDLEPLRHAPFVAPDLGLSPESARRLSPALQPAPAHGRLTAVVGGDESEEFLRQNALIARAWGSARVPVCESVPHRHHMNVLYALADPHSRLHRLGLKALGLGRLPT